MIWTCPWNISACPSALSAEPREMLSLTWITSIWTATDPLLRRLIPRWSRIGFTGNISPAWQWYVPKYGPTYMLYNGFTITLPETQSFEHWTDVDDAPELLRSDLGDGDWAIETRLADVNSLSGAYWAGLEIGFDTFDQVWFGLDNGGQLGTIRVGDAYSVQVMETFPLYMRVEKHAESYTFMYRKNSCQRPGCSWNRGISRAFPPMLACSVGCWARAVNPWASPGPTSGWNAGPLHPPHLPLPQQLPPLRRSPILLRPPSPIPCPLPPLPARAPSRLRRRIRSPPPRPHSRLPGSFTANNTVPTATRTFTRTNTVPTPTSTRTYTRTNTVPTSTRTFTKTNTAPTPTRTFTKTRTVPTSTRTFTRTRTVPTPTKTFTKTNTVPTRTGRDTRTGTP